MRLGRAALGTAAWAGWGLFVAWSLAFLSGIVLVREVLVPDLFLLGAAGPVFPILAFRAEVAPAGRGLTLAALAAAALVLLGSVLLFGRWGYAVLN